MKFTLYQYAMSQYKTSLREIKEVASKNGYTIKRIGHSEHYYSKKYNNIYGIFKKRSKEILWEGSKEALVIDYVLCGSMFADRLPFKSKFKDDKRNKLKERII